MNSQKLLQTLRCNSLLQHLSDTKHLNWSKVSVWGTNYVNAVSSKTIHLQRNRFRFISSIHNSNETGSKNHSKTHTSTNTNKNENSKKKDDSNLLLDNLGKIFLGAIAAIILALIRGSRGTTNRMLVRDNTEQKCLLDPCEIDDLRQANSLFTTEIFSTVMEQVYESFPDGKATYDEFLSVVTSTIYGLIDGNLSIEFGHLLDRIVIGYLEKRQKQQKKDDEEIMETSFLEEKNKLPLPLLFTILSLALNSTVDDRIRLLYSALYREEYRQKHNQDHVGIENELKEDQREPFVSEESMINMVGYLQQTHQLAVDPQILPTTVKYPVQEYAVGKPPELLSRAKKSLLDDGEKNRYNFSESSQTYTCDDFDAILRSMFVCAWGECYNRKKARLSDRE